MKKLVVLVFVVCATLLCAKNFQRIYSNEENWSKLENAFKNIVYRDDVMYMKAMSDGRFLTIPEKDIDNSLKVFEGSWVVDFKEKVISLDIKDSEGSSFINDSFKSFLIDYSCQFPH